MRTCTLLALTCTAALGLAVPASADPPELQPPGEPFDVIACGGATITIAEVDTKTRTHPISGDETTGTVRDTGSYKLELTGPGGSVVVNASGPVVVDYSPTGFSFAGTGPTLVYPEDEAARAAIAAAGLPELSLTNGPVLVEVTTDADTGETLTAHITAPHHVVDLCPLVT